MNAPLNHRMHAAQEAILNHASQTILDDNTAAGMALNQEDSMYIATMAEPNPDIEPYTSTEDEDDVKHIYTSCENESLLSCENSGPKDITVYPEDNSDILSPLTSFPSDRIGSSGSDATQQNMRYSDTLSSARTTPARDEDIPVGLAKVDLGLERTSRIKAWDFTDKKPEMRSPSSLFQPYSKFVGTQQSDRQTYNVEVTILTIDMEQSSLSGYLLIRGLTPDYPMLQTFFTGEIVGGPNQKYSFKTMDPAWGANDKVDLQHWLRFPPWRHLTSYAKRDMGFEYPFDNEPWWTQENVYMRWKEHFLVPDHKQSNIQGASFEGFYYICLNQIEGKVSGVYFHSKSEK